MMIYTTFSTGQQAPVDTVDNPALSDEIGAATYRRLQEPDAYGDVQARHAILTGFERGWWDAATAYDALLRRELFGDVDAFMRTYAAGVRAISEQVLRRAT